MTERSGYQENADGTLTGLGIAKREAHIREIEAQARVIRDRNAQIAELAPDAAASRSYGEMLEQMGIQSFIEGVKAVEIGARVLALGISFDDIQRWREQELTEELRVMRRIHERNKRNEADA